MLLAEHAVFSSATTSLPQSQPDGPAAVGLRHRVALYALGWTPEVAGPKVRAHQKRRSEQDGLRKVDFRHGFAK